MRVFIGYDTREPEAFDVAAYSIKKYAPEIGIQPLKLDELRRDGHYWREHDSLGSTEFTISRFLVPFLSDYSGFSLFIDCDMLSRCDIRNIMDVDEPGHVVYCVQHDYSPHSMTKMDGKQQHVYPRKNWSSVMLFDNDKCRTLSPETVNSETPMYLHRMLWANSIGALDRRWNYLAGYYEGDDPYLIHYTDGGPWFDEYRDCAFADLWINSFEELHKGVTD